MLQQKDTWEILDELSLAYHRTQWDEAKQSTITFERFVHPVLEPGTSVLDLGSGAGAPMAYLARRYPQVGFTGLDCSDQLLELDSALARERRLMSLDFVKGDWFDLVPGNAYDGVLSLQTLSWLPEIEMPMREIFRKLAPEWVALTSLFYEGDVTCTIQVNEYRREKQSFYNIYSIPHLERICREHGYMLAKVEPFEIDLDIERPADLNVMGTFTQRIESLDRGHARRLQFSGPSLMSWYMILIRRIC